MWACPFSHRLREAPKTSFVSGWLLRVVERSRSAGLPPRRRITTGHPTNHTVSFYASTNHLETAVAERLARSHPTKANRVQSSAGSPDFRMWESCWTMPLVGGFSRGFAVFPALSFRRCSTLTSITVIGSQDLAVKSRPRASLFTHHPSCLKNVRNRKSRLYRQIARSKQGGREQALSPRPPPPPPSPGPPMTPFTANSRVCMCRQYAATYDLGRYSTAWFQQSLKRHTLTTERRVATSISQSDASVEVHERRTLVLTLVASHFIASFLAARSVSPAAEHGSVVKQRTLVAGGERRTRRSIRRRGEEEGWGALPHLPMATSATSPTYEWCKFVCPRSWCFQVLRADEGDGEVNMEQRRNAWAWGTGDPRENSTTSASGIAQHDYHMRKSASDPAENRTRFAFVGEQGKGKDNHYYKLFTQAISVYIIFNVWSDPAPDRFVQFLASEVQLAYRNENDSGITGGTSSCGPRKCSCEVFRHSRAEFEVPVAESVQDSHSWELCRTMPLVSGFFSARMRMLTLNGNIPAAVRGVPPVPPVLVPDCIPPPLPKNDPFTASRNKNSIISTHIDGDEEYYCNLRRDYRRRQPNVQLFEGTNLLQESFPPGSICPLVKFHWLTTATQLRRVTLATFAPECVRTAAILSLPSRWDFSPLILHVWRQTHLIPEGSRSPTTRMAYFNKAFALMYSIFKYRPHKFDTTRTWGSSLGHVRQDCSGELYIDTYFRLGRDKPTVIASKSWQLGATATRVQYHSGFSHVGIVPDDGVGRRGFLGDFPFTPPFNSGAAPHTHLDHPSSALKASMLRAVQISSLPRSWAARLPRWLRLGLRYWRYQAVYKLLQKHSARIAQRATNYTETNLFSTFVRLRAQPPIPVNSPASSCGTDISNSDILARTTNRELEMMQPLRTREANLPKQRDRESARRHTTLLCRTETCRQKAAKRGGGKREITEKTRCLVVSSVTIPACEDPGANPPGIDSCSPWWEATHGSLRFPDVTRCGRGYFGRVYIGGDGVTRAAGCKRVLPASRAHAAISGECSYEAREGGGGGLMDNADVTTVVEERSEVASDWQGVVVKHCFPCVCVINATARRTCTALEFPPLHHPNLSISPALEDLSVSSVDQSLVNTNCDVRNDVSCAEQLMCIITPTGVRPNLRAGYPCLHRQLVVKWYMVRERLDSGQKESSSQKCLKYSIKGTAYPEIFSGFEAEKRGSDKGYTSARIKSAFATKHRTSKLTSKVLRISFMEIHT
ncbi:hypothetical protein PR048_018518 [Dryococelus australis]|uniref:Uncharacterized protein n=1 Tax=Dryococelus australis TaxID=614101 RepID=A0ABQ9HCG3_9NEOP|nr:hypothetical protein PR048_018518 [Dryococelus australis]